MRDLGLTPDDLQRQGVDLNGEHARVALGLANLSDNIFTQVGQGKLPPIKGAIIGQELPGNHEGQEAIYRLILKDNTDKNGNVTISDEKLRYKIRFAEFSKAVPTKQVPLPGMEDAIKENLVNESSDLISYAMGKLSRERNLFKTVTAADKRLRAAGNQLNPDKNQKISNDAAVGMAILDKAAFIPDSETNKLFKEFASQLQESKPKLRAKLKEAFYEKLPAALEADRAAAGLGEGPGSPVPGEEAAPAGPGLFPGSSEGAEGGSQYSIKERTEAAFGLSPQKKTASRLESRLTELQSEFPEIDRDKAVQVLRNFPQAENDQIANMVASPEMFNRMVKSTLSEAEQKKMGGKLPGKQSGLFEGGEMGKPGGGRLFSVKEAQERAPVFFSQMANHLEAKLPGKGSGADLSKLVEGWAAKGQFKADELRWSGLLPWLREQKGPVTKQQVADFLKDNQVEVREVQKGGEPYSGEAINARADEIMRRPQNENWETAITWDEARDLAKKEIDKEGQPTKFSGYMQLPPGGENYREVLLTVPIEKTISNGERLRREKLSQTPWRELTPDEQREYNSLYESEDSPGKMEQAFQVPSSHAYGDPAADVNRFAHIFMDDRVIDGKKYLTIWELQSDWGQEGRKKGYRQEQLPAGWEVKQATGTSPDVKFWQVLDDKGNLQASGSTKEAALKMVLGGAPPFPFSKNWHEVAMKKALRMAAEEGYDGVAWANGDMVKDRYDLSKVIDKLNVKKFGDSGNYGLNMYKDGRLLDTQLEVPESELDKYVGKELADKIIKENIDPDRSYIYQGLDLKVGGEWANRQYDQMMPQFLNKYGKQWGAKVGETTIHTGFSKIYEVEKLFGDWVVRKS